MAKQTVFARRSSAGMFACMFGGEVAFFSLIFGNPFACLATLNRFSTLLMIMCVMLLL